jgi:hypothetical protein
MFMFTARKELNDITALTVEQRVNIVTALYDGLISKS